jgi:hypothetical protein
MIFRGETTTEDWAFGKGKQSYLTDNLAIMKNIETRLKTFYSECFFDSEMGVPWFSILGQKNQDLVVLAIKREINDCYGVVQVTDVRYSLDASRALTIRFWVDTIFTTGASGTVTI